MRIIFKIKNASEVRTDRIVLSFYLKTRKILKINKNKKFLLIKWCVGKITFIYSQNKKKLKEVRHRDHLRLWSTDLPQGSRLCPLLCWGTTHEKIYKNKKLFLKCTHVIAN